MQILINEVKRWMTEAGEKLKYALQEKALVVQTKTSRMDLVTNLDREIQNFLIKEIEAFDPATKILAEENGRDSLDDFSGRVYIIDPIDGTMNFVLEGENFCIMLAVYEKGQGILGFVYNVMKGEFLWGGPSIGVYINEERVEMPVDLPLEAGLLGVNTAMYRENYANVQKVSNHSMGVRMSGCAGVELVHLVMGRRVGYISNLAPWDYAAGGVLLQTFGMKMSQLDGAPLNLNGRVPFLAATPTAYQQILAMTQEK
ncbi:inositol monophosphatase family protein [Enterococcus sp. LJL98]